MSLIIKEREKLPRGTKVAKQGQGKKRQRPLYYLSWVFPVNVCCVFFPSINCSQYSLDTSLPLERRVWTIQPSRSHFVCVDCVEEMEAGGHVGSQVTSLARRDEAQAVIWVRAFLEIAAGRRSAPPPRAPPWATPPRWLIPGLQSPDPCIPPGGVGRGAEGRGGQGAVGPGGRTRRPVLSCPVQSAAAALRGPHWPGAGSGPGLAGAAHVSDMWPHWRSLRVSAEPEPGWRRCWARTWRWRWRWGWRWGRCAGWPGRR